MKFAKYWEKKDIPVNGKKFGRDIISVWGASNESPQSAKQNAEKRLNALHRFLDGNFDKSDEYEYWAEFIKEEIIEEIVSEDNRVLAILSRNNYGATVLNTDTVLFGDIDVSPPGFISRILAKLGKTIKDKAFYLEEIKKYQAINPEYGFKVYETYSGLRFIVTNKTFSSEDSSVKEIFTALHVDPLYRHLCKQQECFRARLTPKPWRVGLDRPSSRYPRATDKEQHEFQQWLSKYRTASLDKAATRCLASFGTTTMHPDVKKITELHDRYCCTEPDKLA